MTARRESDSGTCAIGGSGHERHRPVMLEEVLAALALRPGGFYVDATLGEAGYAEKILELSAPGGRLLGIDWDGDAIELSKRRLERFGDRVVLRRESFAGLVRLLEEFDPAAAADGIVVDLGLSTYQLSEVRRGFSFSAEGPLDMRMDLRGDDSAADLVNRLPEKELADLIYRYGEERMSRRIARKIVESRRHKAIETTSELRALVRAAGVRARPGHDPATRTFQALRIAVNRELEQLEGLLDGGWRLLKPGARLAVLSYHSLEDRLVKNAFRTWAAKCLCPPQHPFCDCGWTPKVKPLFSGKKTAASEEIAANPRARSAGLRVVERLAADTVDMGDAGGRRGL